jgi:hypothetical protein
MTSTWYAVVTIARNTLMYSGRSESLAAEAWVSGTHYGKGDSKESAIQNAIEWAQEFRRQREAA